jgi:uncharacterized protein (TIGR01777 family)
MRTILISGSTGLVGTKLASLLKTRDHAVTRLVRREGRYAEPQVLWDPEAGRLDAARLEGFDAVVHLAGEGIANRRWSAAQKRRIRESRACGTRLLAEALAGLTRPPRAFLCASAAGYYGDRGDELLTEESPPGTGFLPEVCRAWEAACEPLRRAGARVVNLRLGVVLSPKGGALAKMLPAFKLGLGGRLGGGRQWMSWISLEDTVGAIAHCLENERVAGPVNLGAPEPVTNAEFTATLARVLHRPAILPAPAWALRLVLGEMADALLLASMRMQPKVLLETQYAWRHTQLLGALQEMLSA